MNYPSFVGPSYQSLAVTADQEDTINWYFETMEVNSSTSRSALYPTPGVSELAAAASGPGRAHFVNGTTEYAVIGTTFWEISEFGTMTNRGTVAIGSNPATISSNGDGGGQLFITSGDNGYIYTIATTTLSQVAALNGIATMGDQLDGYFLALDAATSTLYISDLLDGTTWDPTQFAQRSIAADPWVAMKVYNRIIYLIGSQTSEPWYDAGTFPFPFAAYPNVLLQYGTNAPFSLAIADNALYWLGQSVSGYGMVIKCSGFTPEIISTYPVQKAIQGYSDASDAVGDSYNDLGHTFYLLRFTDGMITWSWDVQNSIWTKRGTWISEDNQYIAWRPVYHALAYNQHRFLDAETGSVYIVSVDYATDVDSREIRRVRRAPGLTDENRELYYATLELDLETGLGLSSGQGSDPQVMMRSSNDGGQTFGSERDCSAGAMGNYNARVRWNRCGKARRRVFEISTTDPIPWRITAAYLTFAEGSQGPGQEQGAR